MQRYHCEALHSADRAEEAAGALRKILETFDEEICASKETEEWVAGGCLRADMVDVDNM